MNLEIRHELRLLAFIGPPCKPFTGSNYGLIAVICRLFTLLRPTFHFNPHPWVSVVALRTADGSETNIYSGVNVSLADFWKGLRRIHVFDWLSGNEQRPTLVRDQHSGVLDSTTFQFIYTQRHK